MADDHVPTTGYSKEHSSVTADVDRSSDFQDDAGGVDAGDMYRMGKEQQFRVGPPPNDYIDVILTAEAYLSRFNHDVLHINGSVDLGSCSHVR
jgi:hypothetical protein